MAIKPFTNVVEHAGTGLLIPETLARFIDENAKGLPAGVGYRRLARSASEFNLDPGERTDISVITSDAVDRDGEVVLPGAIDWKDYNRIVTFAHDYKALPAGACLWIKPKGDGKSTIAKTHYPKKPDDWSGSPWMPSAILHLMQQPVPTCTGKSVGFIPTRVRTATQSELSVNPDWKGRPLIESAKGLEYAVAPIPVNQTCEMEAVAKCKSLGLIDDDLAAILTKAIGSESANGGNVVGDEDMPPCPNCKSMENVKKKDDDGGNYLCMKCDLCFTTTGGTSKAVEPPKQEEKPEADAGIPFILPQTIAKARARQSEELKEWIKSEVAKVYGEAWARITGTV